MKTLFGMTAALALTAGVVAAQTTTQQAVLGQSGNPAYPVEVRGTNGVLYQCGNNIVVVDGVRVRECIRPGSGGLFSDGNGLAAGAAVGAGALLLLALADDDNTPSTTTTGSGGTVSDMRVKTDITWVGMADNGLPVYNFRYRGDDQTFQGVMAQDVLKVMPEAISMADEGYMRVNYEMLGMEMHFVN